jgi:hypothetical protein
VAYWVISSTNIDEPIWIAPGQVEGTTLAAAIDANPISTLTQTNLASQEHKVIARLMVQRIVASPYYSIEQIDDYRNVADEPSSGSAIIGDHGLLTGLGDDDHTIYVLADGTRDLAYTPAVAADWDGDADPGDVDDALDQLAERVDDLEGPILSGLATAQMVTGGASDGTASEFGDGAFLHVDETTGSPGFDIRFTWTGVTSFSRVLLYAIYSGATTHGVAVQLYNATETRWDTFHSMQSSLADVSTSDGYIVSNGSFDVPSQWVSDYINSGTVVLRLYHTPSGDASHDVYVDYAALLS